jgi:hypothetical protein
METRGADVAVDHDKLRTGISTDLFRPCLEHTLAWGLLEV